MIRKSLVRLVLGLGLALLSAPASAYTIVFKDGSSLITLAKYRIEGDLAVATLPSGTPTSFPAAEIDVERTEQLNKMGVERGVLLRGPDQQERAELRAGRDTLADLARGGYTDLRLPDRSQGDVRRTFAGNLDLFSLQRKEPTDTELATEVESALRAEGQSQALVFAGTQPSRLLVDITTENENEVFAALGHSAAALMAVRESGSDLEALEILLSTQRRIRAGQFLMTPESAQALLGEELTVEEFFLLFVQF